MGIIVRDRHKCKKMRIMEYDLNSGIAVPPGFLSLRFVRRSGFSGAPEAPDMSPLFYMYCADIAVIKRIMELLYKIGMSSKWKCIKRRMS